MAHSHSVYDSDPHFVIDPITRAITNADSKKTILMQNDHNSERFSFEIGRYVEEHDVTLCDKVEIHYTNTDSTSRAISAGVYEVDDLIIDPTDENKVVFTWLISENATMYAGSLAFLIQFSCVEGGQSVYRWNTCINSGITIARGMNNGQAIVEAFPDILAQWKDELFAAASGVQVISVGPVEPEMYPYLWFDTSEYLGTTEKNVGYLTIKGGDGVKQRLYPVVKMESIEGLADTIKSLRSDIDAQNTTLSNMDTALDAMYTSLQDETSTREQADLDLEKRIDDLETLLTGVEAAIAHSLTGKGVEVPDDMSISDVAGLIDTITMDVPTSLQGITIMTAPDQTGYYVGDVFDPTGMVILADFGDGATITTTDYTVTPIEMTEGLTDVTISVTVNGVTATATQPVTVEEAPAQTVQYGTMKSETTVYSEASTSSTSQTILSAGTKVRIKEYGDSWCKISYTGGNGLGATGYVQTSKMTITTE